MENKKQYIKVGHGILVFLFTLIVIITMQTTNVNYDDISYEIDEIMNSTKKPTNTAYEKSLIYLPKGYKQTEDPGLLLTDGINYFEVYINNDSKEPLDTNILINSSRDTKFQKTFFDTEKIEIYIWEISDNGIEVLISKNGSYIVGNIKKSQAAEKMIDMANIIHSII